MNQIRSVQYAHFGVLFSISMLAGFGLEQFLKKRLSASQYALGLSWLLFITIFSLTCFLLSSQDTASYYSYSSRWLGSFILLLIAVGIGVTGTVLRKRKIAGVLLAFLVLVNLLYFKPGFTPVAKIIPQRWRFQNPEPLSLLAPLHEDKSLYRIIGFGKVLSDNYNLLYRLNDLRVYEALYPEAYVRMIAEIEGFAMEHALVQFLKSGWHFTISEKNLTHPLLNKLGLKYLFSDYEINSDGWELVNRTSFYFLYRNPNAWSRVWIKNDFIRRIDFEGAQIKSYLPDQVLIRLNNIENAELILADQYAVGWKAISFPSRSQRRIFPEEGIFRKVALKKGDQEIKFYYQPWGFRIGLYFSLTSLALFLSGTGFGFFRKKFSNAGLNV